MFYENLGKGYPRKVSEDDAFCIACGLTEDGTQEEKDEFMNIMKTSDSFSEARARLTEWFYSGNWVRREGECY